MTDSMLQVPSPSPSALVSRHETNPFWISEVCEFHEMWRVVVARKSFGSKRLVLVDRSPGHAAHYESCRTKSKFTNRSMLPQTLHSHIHSFLHSPLSSIIQSLTMVSTRSFSYPSVLHQYTRSLTIYSLMNPLTHSLTHSLSPHYTTISWFHQITSLRH